MPSFVKAQTRCMRWKRYVTSIWKVKRIKSISLKPLVVFGTPGVAVVYKIILLFSFSFNNITVYLFGVVLLWV